MWCTNNEPLSKLTFSTTCGARTNPAPGRETTELEIIGMQGIPDEYFDGGDEPNAKAARIDAGHAAGPVGLRNRLL